MLGPAFCQSSGFHQLLRAEVPGGVDPYHLKGALGQGTGLVEHYDAGACQLLQISRTLYQNATGRGTADASKKAQGDGNDQRTGAADDQEGQGTVDPLPELRRLSQHQQHHRRQEGKCQCAVADGRGVHPGKPGDEVLGTCLFHAGIFHKVQDLGHGGFPKFLGGPHLQQTGHIHAAANDLIPSLYVPGQTLAGKGGGVQGGGTFHDDSVNGHPLAGLYKDHGPHFHVIGVHLLQLALFVLHVGVVRSDVHQGTDALAALAHRHTLEQFTDLIEDNNGAALHIVSQCKGTHRGNRHQEAFIKGLTVLDALQCLAQHIPAHYKVGDAVKCQFHRHGKFRQQTQNPHHSKSDEDPVQRLFLLFGHTKNSFLVR